MHCVPSPRPSPKGEGENQKATHGGLFNKLPCAVERQLGICVCAVERQLAVRSNGRPDEVYCDAKFYFIRDSRASTASKSRK